MADSFIGKFAYAYQGGKAFVHLTDWEYTLSAPTIGVDPDIGTTRTLSVPGFITENGSISFNLTTDDFANIRDAVVAQSAVGLYLYPHKSDTSNKMYLYGNAYLGDLNITSTLLGTVKGRVAFMNSDTTGFSRQNRA